MTLRSTKVSANQLTLGMFVDSVDGKDTNGFPANGVLIETQDQLATLRSMCSLASIDLSRSSDKVYELWSATQNSMSITEKVNLTAVVSPTRHEESDYSQPQLNPEEDRFGYKGRFIYRVLENHVTRFIDGELINLEQLDKELNDYIAYTNINPDLLQLESRLTARSSSLAAIGLRAIVHISLYAHSFNKNEAFIQPIALSTIIYMVLLNKLPKSITRHSCLGDEADNAIRSHAIQRHFKKLANDYQFPMHVKKTLAHLSERHNGAGPLKLSGQKISASSQLINLAFTFELLQSTAFNSKASTASEAINLIRSKNNEIFNPCYLEKTLQVMPLFPTGSIAQIGPKQLALVTQQHPLRKLNPHLMAITDEDGQELEELKAICSDVRLGTLKQTPHYFAHEFESNIRESLEVKMPWYKRLLNPARLRSWFQ